MFSTGWGDEPLLPDAVTKWWDKLRDFDAHLDGLRFQDLRHAHASELHAAGYHPAAVAAHLGHSTEVSLATYDHVRPGAGPEMAAVIDAAWRQL